MQADEYFDSKEFKRILSEYEESERMGVPCIISSDDYADIAEYYHSKGDNTRAQKAVETAIRLYPGATMPLVFAARLALLIDKDPKKASDFAEQIDDKSDLEYIYIKAEIMLAANREDEAEEYLRDCFEDIPDDERDDYTLDVAALYVDYTQWQLAKQWLELCEDTEATDYQELHGTVLIHLGHFEEGEKLINKLIDQNPFSGKYWNTLATSQLIKGNIQDSIASSEYSIAISPDDSEAILNKANGLMMLGNYAEAQKYFHRFCELLPNDCNGELLQAMCLINIDQQEEALEHLRKAEQLLSYDHLLSYDVYYETAFCLSKLGRVEEALEYVDRTEQCNCDHDEMTVLRGHIYLENHQEDKATRCFVKAIKDSNYSPHLIMRIAMSAFDNGYMQGAYDIMHMVISPDAQEGDEGYSYLACCCHQLGKREEFLENLEKAVRVNPNEAKLVLGELFPTGMNPEEYYEYAKNNIK